MRKGIQLAVSLMLSASSAAYAAEAAQEKSSQEGVASQRLDKMKAAGDNPFVLLAYEPNYIIYTVTSDVNKEAYAAAGKDKVDDINANEAKFQISLLIPMWRGLAGSNSTLAASYTQVSMWQIPNSVISSPFRETNYEPQIFMNWSTEQRWGDWHLSSFDLGFNHQSNGRTDALSRSWNRLYANFIVENGDFAIQFKPWYRLPEDAENDDNPDIEKYLGHQQLNFAYKLGEHVLSAKTKFNFSTGKGGAELGWSYPILKRLRLYTQVYQGYGETLIDYNHEQTRIGAGVMLNDLL